MTKINYLCAGTSLAIYYLEVLPYLFTIGVYQIPSEVFSFFIPGIKPRPLVLVTLNNQYVRQGEYEKPEGSEGYSQLAYLI